MEHEHHNHHPSPAKNYSEYVKFVLVLLSVVIGSIVAMRATRSNLGLSFFESFMGVFFLVFGAFKLINLREFAYGFQSYDVVAKRSLAYAYAYPFLQLGFGISYLLGQSATWLNLLVLSISLLSAVGVVRAISSKADVHCVCLGNVIKLPLSTISFVEDFGMAIMAFFMLLY